MKIGIMFSGIMGGNGADFVALALAKAVLKSGHKLSLIGAPFRPIAGDIPSGLDVVVQSSGYGLTPAFVEKARKKTKFCVWTHNDEMPSWQFKIQEITRLVDVHFSYTRDHVWGSHVVFLPLAADADDYFLIRNSTKKYDASMIGCPHPGRVNFGKLLAQRFSRSFFNYTMSMSEEFINRLYNETHVVVSPIQDCDVGCPGGSVYGCPCRTFEVSAAGAFQLQVLRGGLFDIFPRDLVEQVTLSQGAQSTHQDTLAMWVSAIEKWISLESQREEIAEEMGDVVRQFHLYDHRLETILDHI